MGTKVLSFNDRESVTGKLDGKSVWIWKETMLKNKIKKYSINPNTLVFCVRLKTF